MKQLFITLAVTTVLMLSCKKKDNAPPTVPTLTTSAVTNVSGSAAQSGGTITGNGNATITASGICWSKTNNTPIITDDTTKGATSTGTFTAMLKNLQPSATYYVRAYATNSAGTGYGNVVTFNTGNGAPQAKNITIVGTAAVTNKIKVTYSYFDFENDPQVTASYQWYVATDTTTATPTSISGATDSIYTVAASDQNKFLRVSITPKSSNGTSPGAATNSYWVGPVAAEPTSVTFTYNGASVTYGIIISPVTQKRWLDRNLGATRAATAVDDYQAYGDMFQWGRPADGHQLITWSNSTTGAPVNGTTATLATSDAPGNNLFISTQYDWRSDNNTNRWITNPQGPCPNGWHVPTESEWRAETGITNATTGFNQLKLTEGGLRLESSGNPLLSGSRGDYWGSSQKGSSPTGVFYYSISSSGVDFGGMSGLARGEFVRCTKD